MRGAVTVLAAALALLIPAAAANGGGRASRHAPILGVVPQRGTPNAAGGALSPVAAPADDLVLNHPADGRVMRTNAAYAIYWVPSGPTACDGSPCHVSPNYQTLIDRYLTDVAAASGETDNVYATDTQYYDSAGAIAYQSTFGGSNLDRSSFPVSGCDDGVDAVCLTDQQLRTEIENVLSTNNWHPGATTMFFIMTPEGVGSCFQPGDASAPNQECTSPGGYCAYHSAFFAPGGEPVIYANEPYDATIKGCFSAKTGQGKPNGDDADVEINTISHEQNEAITDPWGDAWYAADGDEVADLCGWNFGPPIGTVGGQPYNQVINGHDYSLQQEWSNTSPVGADGTKCVQRYSAGLLSPPTNIASPTLSGTAAVGRSLVSSTGFWAGQPSDFSYQWQRCDPGGSLCSDIAGATRSSYQPSATDAGRVVRSVATAVNSGGSSGPATSATSEVVVPLPASTSQPVVSGVAAVGQALSTTSGAWNTSVSIGYQWLRCAATGSGCTPVSGATSTTYVATSADAGQLLEASVSATNAAGTSAALSAPTSAVIGVPAATTSPRISGLVRVGRRLTAGPGTWSGPPDRYRYEWLRCNTHGRSCVPISGASRPTYRLTQHDRGHRLRVRITAVNLAGTDTAISAPSARVRTAPKR